MKRRVVGEDVEKISPPTSARVGIPRTRHFKDYNLLRILIKDEYIWLKRRNQDVGENRTAVRRLETGHVRKKNHPFF